MCSVLYRGTKRSFTQYQSEGLVPALRYKVVLLLRTVPWWYGHHRTVKRTHSMIQRIAALANWSSWCGTR